MTRPAGGAVCLGGYLLVTALHRVRPDSLTDLAVKPHRENGVGVTVVAYFRALLEVAHLEFARG